MIPVLIAGFTIVNLALVSYAAGKIIENRKKSLSKAVLCLLTIGVVFDLTSTICMITGSGKAMTLHGVIG